MKTKFISYLALLAIATGFSACNNDNWNPGINHVDGEGQLSTRNLVPEVLNAEKIINDYKGPNSIKSRATTELSDFIVTVTNDATGEQAAKWAFAEMPSLPTFGVGTYTLKVESHEVQPVEWDKPYFLGTEQFQIKNGEITEINTVVCKLANIRVSVTFDEKLKEAAAGDIKVSVTSADNHTATFTADETRSAYFQAMGELKTLEVHFTGTIGGTAEDFTRVLTDVEAGQHRKITFSLKNNGNLPPDEFGQIGEGEGINVSTDVVEEDLTADTTWEEETGDNTDRPNHEGPEPTDPNDPNKPGTEDPQPPTEDPVKFESSTLDLEGVNNCSDFGPDKKEAVINIHADKGIKKIHVKIDSNTLTADELAGVGLAGEFDLDDPKELESTLKDNLHFPVGDEVVGKNDVKFDITQFVPLLAMLGEGNHNFILTVTDMDGAVKEITLKLKS